MLNGMELVEIQAQEYGRYLSSGNKIYMSPNDYAFAVCGIMKDSKQDIFRFFSFDKAVDLMCKNATVKIKSFIDKM